MFSFATQTPVSALNDWMNRVKVRPKYAMVFQEARAGRVVVMMSVNCPLRPHTEPLTAYSSYCTSEKEAKHSAALAYLNNYLRDKTCPPYSSSVINLTRRPEDKIYFDELEELETICLENGVHAPMYLDVSSERCKVNQMECHVSDLRTKGIANNKVDARRLATKKMIEMLSEMRSNPEDSEPPAQNHEISSSSDDPMGNQLVPDESKSDSTPSLIKSSEPLESVASGIAGCSSSVEWSSPVDSGTRKLTRLQAASRSTRTFKTLERELLDNILGFLDKNNLPHQTTVKFLHQEFLVVIQPDSPPVIFEELGECSDHSIRIACLSKLFQNLTENIA